MRSLRPSSQDHKESQDRRIATDRSAGPYLPPPDVPRPTTRQSVFRAGGRAGQAAGRPLLCVVLALHAGESQDGAILNEGLVPLPSLQTRTADKGRAWPARRELEPGGAPQAHASRGVRPHHAVERYEVRARHRGTEERQRARSRRLPTSGLPGAPVPVRDRL